MKFDLSGQHPIEDRHLNLIEQINQTWTYVAALEAARILLNRHKAKEFELAPGAHAALTFDIESTCKKICAETFAAVRLQNNSKLEKDLSKLERHPKIKHRYIFFIAPNYLCTERQRQFERSEIEVWSVYPKSLLTAPAPASPGRAPPASADTSARPSAGASS
jgi:hypothetical protein